MLGRCVRFVFVVFVIVLDVRLHDVLFAHAASCVVPYVSLPVSGPLPHFSHVTLVLLIALPFRVFSRSCAPRVSHTLVLVFSSFATQYHTVVPVLLSLRLPVDRSLSSPYLYTNVDFSKSLLLSLLCSQSSA